MHVVYVPGQGFSWSPTALDIPAVKVVHEEWQDCGLYYICLFGHPLSVHAKTTDLDEREKAVIGEMQAAKLGKKSKQGGFSYPKGFYKTEKYASAEAELLQLQSVPDVTQVAYLKRKLANYQKQSDAVVWSTDVDTYNKQVTAAKNLQGLINQTHKELSEAEAQVQKLISQSGIISLDAIWSGI